MKSAVKSPSLSEIIIIKPAHGIDFAERGKTVWAAIYRISADGGWTYRTIRFFEFHYRAIHKVTVCCRQRASQLC